MSSLKSASAIAVSSALETVLRNDRGRLLAALTFRLGSIQLAEDALQEASISALTHWSREGLPDSPQGWLIRVAFRKALDQIRSKTRSEEREEDMFLLNDLLGQDEPEEIPDERLRMIFTCCHPALELKSRIALTLRTVCGISTAEIARLFLDAEPTIGQRLTRAKTKIAQAGIAYVVPQAEFWDERLQAVLTTIYLIFTTGYTTHAVAQGSKSRDLCEEALFLMNLLNLLCPEQAEIEGAWALLLLTDSRRAARVSSAGATVPPAKQDRALWDRTMEAKGKQLLQIALSRKRAGPFQVKAAISACQMAEPEPDWQQILALYTVLLSMEPTPVVRLNHAVALAETCNVQGALVALNELREPLAEFQPFYATEAAVLLKAGQREGARKAFEKAIELSENESDRKLLLEQLRRLG